MKECLPYTYIIGWSKYNKFYYGSRTAKGCDPSDLWNTYFTSSKYVSRFRVEFGDPDIIEIDLIFSNAHSCLLYEEMFHRYANVTEDDMWLNESFACGEFSTNNKAIAKTKSGENIGLVSLDDPRWASGDIIHNNTGIKNDKISNIRKNRYWSSTSDQSRENNRKSAIEWHSDPERNKNHGASLLKVHQMQRERGDWVGEKNPMYNSARFGEKNPMYGRKHSEETRRKMSERRKNQVPYNKGVPMSEENKAKLRGPKTEEHKQKMKDAWVRRKKSQLVGLWAWILFKQHN